MAKRKRTAKRIDSRLAKREGGKVQVSIGNIREVRAKLETMIAEEAALQASKYKWAHAPLSGSKTLREMMNRIDRKAEALLKKMRKAKHK